MCTPACYTRAGKERSIELLGQVEHVIYKPRIEIHVGAYALVYRPSLRDLLWSEPLHRIIESEFILEALFLCQLLNKALEYHLSGIGLGVNSVSQTVYQAEIVKGFLVQHICKI